MADLNSLLASETATAEGTLPPEALPEPRSQGKLVLRKFLHHKLAMASTGVLGDTGGVAPGAGSARKSWPHTSQNRPSRGVAHSGQGSPAGSTTAGATVDGATEDGATAGGAPPIGAPHSSQ